MPANFPEFWLSVVERNFKATDRAPWLDGIPEIPGDVQVINGGSKSEKNTIHIPLSEFEVDVLINNTTYPIAVQEYDDDEIIINLDKFQTLATSISDDQTIGASYDKVNEATRNHQESILSRKYIKAIHALAPNSNTANTPVVLTSGPVHGGLEFGRKIFTYDDIVAMKDKFDALEVPMEGRRLVLSTDHWNDALLDRKRFGDQLVNYRTGMPAPMIAGFSLYQYVANPHFTGTNKKAFGSLPVAGDYRASVAFHESIVGKKTGMTRQYFEPSTSDTRTQTNLLNYRHYFIAVPKRAKYIGAIASAEVVDPG
ncbi:hypothetical protein MM236_19145 [Belliella sp. DSM 107340]|uniref:Major capsid protein n=1 Tax=Belliella calami TaxID=2923436 RepID=A0ABS9UV78_9BACT|nr:hypothetical protein [Belliella calami]MCH7400120.1 hypothetical protein [Belliella calami]